MEGKAVLVRKSGTIIGRSTSQEINFNLTSSNVMDMLQENMHAKQVDSTAPNKDTDCLKEKSVSEKKFQKDEIISNLHSERESETKTDTHYFINQTLNYSHQGNTQMKDFEELSRRMNTHENSRIKEFLETQNFSCIKSGTAQENQKNFMDMSQMDSFYKQFTSFQHENSQLKKQGYFTISQ